MASIWNDIEIEYKGKTYKVRPTMNFINQVEQGPGNSITMLYHRVTQGDMPTGKACEVIALVINFADPDRKTPVDAEDVLEETGGIGIDIMKILQTILLACLPTPKESKTTANAKKKPPKKAVTSTKRTGRKSTG